MLETTSAAQSSDAEKEKKSKRASFIRAMCGAVGGAAFCGLLGMIGQSFANMKAGRTATSLLDAMPLSATVGLVAVGTIGVYLSQREDWPYKEPEQSADAKDIKKSITQTEAALSPMLEQAPSRMDGKNWTAATAPDLSKTLIRS